MERQSSAGRSKLYYNIQAFISSAKLFTVVFHVPYWGILSPHRPSLCRTVPQSQKSGYTDLLLCLKREQDAKRTRGVRRTAAGLNRYSHQSINQCVTFRGERASDPHVLKDRSRQLLQLRLPGGMARVTYAHVRATCVSISVEIRAFRTHFAGDFQRSATQSNILSPLPCSLIKWLPRKSE